MIKLDLLSLPQLEVLLEETKQYLLVVKVNQKKSVPKVQAQILQIKREMDTRTHIW